MRCPRQPQDSGLGRMACSLSSVASTNQVKHESCSGCKLLLIPASEKALSAPQNNHDGLPRLDGFLAAQITDPKHLKGKFGVAAQTFVERAHALGVLPSGRALLATLSKRFRVDRIRGATVPQHPARLLQSTAVANVPGALRILSQRICPGSMAIRVHNAFMVICQTQTLSIVVVSNRQSERFEPR